MRSFRGYRSGTTTYELLVILTIVVVVIVFVVFSVRDCKKRKACEQRGGTVIETNCRFVTNCTNDGKGNTRCTTTNVCDWRCDMSRAEAERP